MSIEPTKRLDELDSLRGLAAMTVVLHHFKLLWLDDTMSGALPHHSKLIDVLLMPVTAGPEAVILFFVLSGFVLSIPAVDRHAQNYSVFVVRRLFRIYAPYIVALGLAVVGSIFIHGDPTRGESFRDFWLVPVDWNLVKQHVFFLGVYDSERFNPPIWSLILEMRISLIFPFLCAIALKLKPHQSLVMAVCVSGVSIVANKLVHSTTSSLGIFSTLHFAALFVVGIYLARQRECIAQKFGSLSKHVKIELVILSALLFVYGGVFLREILGKLTHSTWGTSSDWSTALGAAGLIVASLNIEWCRRTLHWAPIHALGKMSYSVYLLHYMIMFVVVHLLYGKLPLLVIFAICLAFVIAVSWAFYRFVEMPFIAMGRRLSGCL